MPRRQRDSRPDNFDPVRLLRVIEGSNILDEPAVPRLLLAAYGTDNPSIRYKIGQTLFGAAAAHKSQPFRKVSQFEQSHNHLLSAGIAFTGSEYYFEQRELNRHLLVIGQSGAGKTTLFYNLMDQLSVPFWAFDLKQDYRHLIQERGDVLVLPWTELKFNPLKPPEGVPVRRWTQVLAEIFGHATALLSGSKNYLMKRLSELYQLYDLYEDGAGAYPSLHELQLMGERDKINYVRKTSKYRDTVLNRLEAMNLTAGSIFDCSTGYPIEELLDRNVVFEFDGLGNDLQNFLMEILFAYVYEYRVARNQRGGELRHVFFLDEGKRVFSVYKERQDAAGIPEIDELTAKMREFGEGLVVADQEASKLTDSIKANTYTKVLLPTGDAKQFDDMAASMNLTERQEELARELGVGEAIVQSGNQEPVPVKLARFELDKSVTDQELREIQEEEWESLDFEPRQTVPAFEEAVSWENSEDEVPQSDSNDSELDISEAGHRLLRDIAENPFKALTERYDLFASNYKGNKAKDEIVDAKLVVERSVRVAPEKRKLLQLTEIGRDYLADQDIEVVRKGRGGIIHQFWQHRIKEMFEDAGWNPKAEMFDADVYVHLGGSELVVEVAMENKSREVEHVKQHLETGFDFIWVVCRDEEVRAGLKERLAEQGLLDDRITFRVFSELSGMEIGSVA